MPWCSMAAAIADIADSSALISPPISLWRPGSTQVLQAIASLLANKTHIFSLTAAEKFNLLSTKMAGAGLELD